jgi:uncharacterized protein YqhQ
VFWSGEMFGLLPISYKDSFGIAVLPVLSLLYGTFVFNIISLFIHHLAFPVFGVSAHSS